MNSPAPRLCSAPSRLTRPAELPLHNPAASTALQLFGCHPLYGVRQDAHGDQRVGFGRADRGEDPRDARRAHFQDQQGPYGHGLRGGSEKMG